MHRMRAQRKPLDKSQKSTVAPVVPESSERNFALFRAAYSTFDGWLRERPGIETLEQLELKLRLDTETWLTGDPKTSRTAKKLPWEFDDALFPSLFEDGLSVLQKGVPMTLPDSLEWNLESVRQHVQDPIAKFLLAFIWKQRDFSKARLALDGFRSARKAAEKTRQDAPSVTIAPVANEVSALAEQEASADKNTEESSAVLIQFGRHLAEPTREPIFDQHTSRASLLLENLSMWKSVEDFERLFTSVPPIIPFDAAKITAPEQCLRYTRWWAQRVRPRLPPLNSNERQEALLSVDRLLFGLGKWATPKKWKIKKPRTKRDRKT